VRNCKTVCLGLMFVNFHLEFSKLSISTHWNALKQHAVDCNTVSSFKMCLDHYIIDRGFL